MIGDEKKRPELLIQLERGIFDGPRRERSTWPPAIDRFGDIEGPADEPVDEPCHPRLARTDREERTADVVGIAGPYERQDLVIGEDGDGVGDS